MIIYQHEYLTKMMFCSLDVVKLFQKVTWLTEVHPLKLDNYAPQITKF